MKAEWIVREGSNKLLLLFNGWGMDRRVADHLLAAWSAPGRDMVLLYDYRDLTLPLPLQEVMTAARSIDLMAWSLGVWAATKARIGPIDRAVAINGTPFPVDAGRGIPPEIFRGTLEQWDDGNRKRFERRMYGGVPPEVIDTVRSARLSPDQKEELRSIGDAVFSPEAPAASWDYSRAFIGGRDLIFTPENQRRAWPPEVPVTDVAAMPHFPFCHLGGWREVFA